MISDGIPLRVNIEINADRSFDWDLIDVCFFDDVVVFSFLYCWSNEDNNCCFNASMPMRIFMNGMRSVVKKMILKL